MVMLKGVAVLFIAVTLTGCGLSDSNGCLGPLDSPVRIRPVEYENLDNWRNPKPVIEMATVQVYPACYTTALSWTRGRHGALRCYISGVDCSDANFGCNMPASGALPLSQIPFEYDATISYDEFTDRYHVYIDDTLIRLTPQERHFTILSDSVYHRSR
jgi:hypothetical protein